MTPPLRKIRPLVSRHVVASVRLDATRVSQSQASPADMVAVAFERVTSTITGRSFAEITAEWEEEDRREADELDAALSRRTGGAA